jgi:pilus assembly protein CpaF
MVAMTGLGLPGGFVRTQIANAVQLIVQVERMRDGIRRITEITEVTGMEGDIIAMRELFKYEPTGEDTNGRLIGKFHCFGGRPHFVNRAAYYGLEKDLIMAMQLHDEKDETEF